MCTTCGCGNAEARFDGQPTKETAAVKIAADASLHPPDSQTPYARVTPEAAVFGRAHHHGGHRHGYAAASASRTLSIERDLLAKNDAIARGNRRFLGDRGVFAVNLVSSPGSGKTTLLVKTIAAWGARTPLAVIEGDQQTSRDADRVREAGAPAVQVNTGKGCHLDAQMIATALPQLALADESLLLIENVGNLVCPAAFDLGEAHKVVILSVTEGDDKPLKYPDMFRAADLLVLNKTDLLPHVEFDVEAAIGHARRVRPGIDVILVSARTGDGLADWIAWLERGISEAVSRRPGVGDAPPRRMAAAESGLGSAAAK